MNKKLIGSYRNGNYDVFMYEDGTKIRLNDLDTFAPDFPESIDCKITNRCDKNCPMCHERSHPEGEHADLTQPFFDSLHPYTELAIGGGNVLEHPDLYGFLERMQARRVICNMTLHIDHFLAAYDYVRRLQDEGLIHGVGISLNQVITSPDIIQKIRDTPNAVIHTIAGVMPTLGYVTLCDEGLRLLILGYKTYGRGVGYYNAHPDITKRIVELHSMLPGLMQHFQLVSFDNLALDQLRVKALVDPDTWERCYMGDDGQATMYIDAVKRQFARSSTSERFDINEGGIECLFNQISVR